MRVLSLVILAACAALGLVLVPLGLPGLWVIVGGVLGSGWLTGFDRFGAGPIVTAVGLALLGDLTEWWLSVRFTRRYGGSRRAGWGALLGGVVGAGVGVPVPVVGSIAGALVGSFVGAALFELTAATSTDAALAAGWGALLGRAAGTAAKVALGLVIAVVGVFAVLRAP